MRKMNYEQRLKNFNSLYKLNLENHNIVEERENYKVELRKKKIEEIIFDKRKIKNYCLSNNCIKEQDIPKQIIDCFLVFDTLSNKSNFIMNLLKSNDNLICLYCSIKYNSIIFSLEEQPDKYQLFKEIFSIDIINTFFALIPNNKELALQREVIIILINLSYLDIFKYSQLTTDHIKIIQNLLLTPDDVLVDDIFKFLNNIIITDQSIYQLDEGLIEMILIFINNSQSNFKETNILIMTRIIKKFIFNEEDIRINHNQLDYLIMTISKIFNTENVEIFHDLVSVLYHLSKSVINHELFIMNLNLIILKKLFILDNLLSLKKSSLKHLLLLYINITQVENESFIEEFIEMGLLDQLNILLNKSINFMNLISYMLIIISNICVDSFKNTQRVFEQGIFHLVIKLLSQDNPSNTTDEILFLLSTACGASDKNLTRKFIKLGIFDIYIDIIGRKFSNMNQIILSLEGLYNIFLKGGDDNNFQCSNIPFDISRNIFTQEFYEIDGLEYIKKLLFFKNDRIRYITEKIFEEFFNFKAGDQNELIDFHDPNYSDNSDSKLSLNTSM